MDEPERAAGSDDRNSCYVGPDEEPDRYRLVRLVGGGGEGNLWLAERNICDSWTPVAVKVLHKGQSLLTATMRRRWDEQVSILRLIQHQGVVGVHESFDGPRMHHAGRSRSQRERDLYLIMNWIEGHTLTEWLSTQTEPEDMVTVLQSLEQLALIIQAMHNGEAADGIAIIHRDLKPSNVMITRRNQVVVIDFGLASMAGRGSGTIEGTRGYWAPEVASSGTFSPASDAYAFGALSVYALTGEHPSEDPNRVRELVGSLPMVRVGGSELLDRLLAIFDPDPVKRPTPIEWLRTLRARSHSTSKDSTGAAVPPPKKPSHPRPKVPPPPSAVEAPLLRSPAKWAMATALTLVLAAGLIITGIILNGQGKGGGADPAHGRSAEIPDSSGAPMPAETVFTVVPEVSGWDAEQAVAYLQAGGLTVSRSVDYDEKAAENTVSGTAPAAGEPVNGPVVVRIYRVPVPVYLSDIGPQQDSIEFGDAYKGGSAFLAGGTYKSSLAAACYGPNRVWAEYYLGGNFQTFRATLGISIDSARSGEGRFVVRVDGKVGGGWSIPRDDPQDIEVDLSGAKYLEIAAFDPDQENYDYCDGVATFVWGDARLERAP